jgi:hypothetical protein
VEGRRVEVGREVVGKTETFVTLKAERVVFFWLGQAGGRVDVVAVYAGCGLQFGVATLKKRGRRLFVAFHAYQMSLADRTVVQRVDEQAATPADSCVLESLSVAIFASNPFRTV